MSKHRPRSHFPTVGIYECLVDLSNYHLTKADGKRFIYLRPADYVSEESFIGDCWIVDKDGEINPGTNVSPVPVHLANIGRRIDQ